MWDTRSGEQLHTLTGHTSGVLGVALSADATRAASAGRDGTVRVWDTRSGEQLHTLTGHTNGVNGVALSADATRAASAGSDGTVRVWDTRSGEQLHTLTGHTNGVNGVALSADATRAASAGSDGTVRVWDAGPTDHGGRAGEDAGRRRELLALHMLPGGEVAALSADAVVACSAGAWRWLGWLVDMPDTGERTRLPAETFGPLPVTGTP